MAGRDTRSVHWRQPTLGFITSLPWASSQFSGGSSSWLTSPLSPPTLSQATCFQIPAPPVLAV